MKNFSKIWPVPDSYSKKLPKNENSGGFWENRGDRFHCGVDIYAPKNSEIFSIKDGKVLDIGIFTNSEMVSYWNKTYYVDILTDDNLIFRYAELKKPKVSNGEKVRENDLVGFVGQVLNFSKINDSSPEYIKKLKNNKKCSMLHFEVYENNSLFQEKEYLGGNWFGNEKPGCLKNPKKVFVKIK